MASGKPKPLSPNSHSGVPALIHRSVIQKGKQNGFTAPAAGPLYHPPSARRTWRTRNATLASSTREVLHKWKDTEPCSKRQRFKPPDASGLLTLANQKHRTRFARWKSATDCLSSPSEEALYQTHRNSALESPRCSTDLKALASQNHHPGIPLSTHRRSSISPTPRGRLTSNHHRPKADNVSDRHLT